MDEEVDIVYVYFWPYCVCQLYTSPLTYRPVGHDTNVLYPAESRSKNQVTMWTIFGGAPTPNSRRE